MLGIRRLARPSLLADCPFCRASAPRFRATHDDEVDSNPSSPLLALTLHQPLCVCGQ